MTNTASKTKRAGTLAALTSAALALPGISQMAQADSPPAKTELGYRFSQYQESNVPQGDIQSGSSDRYDVDINQFRLVTPVGENYGLTIDSQYETLSGASPMGVVLDANGKTKVVMSGASISDTRYDVSATLKRYREMGSFSGTLGYSQEDDYTAYNGALEMEHLLNNRQTTLSGGIGYSDDTIEPTQATGYTRPTDETKQSYTAFIGVAQVLTANWQVQTSAYGSLADGYLSDPYRTRDVRPDQRQIWAWTTRSRYYMASFDAALHTDYRLYNDDWGIWSHTIDLSWHQTVAPGLRLIPMLRYYSQSQADFYKPYDSVANQGYQSSDYRLSPFGAITYGLGAVSEHGDWTISANVERYVSDGDFALESVDIENPGLVDYMLVTVGLDYKF